jgi:hypothetical protein
LDFDLHSLLDYCFLAHNSIHWHVLSQEMGCSGHLPTLLLFCFLVFWALYRPWSRQMAWSHCRVPLRDSSGSDRNPMESVGLASQAGWQMISVTASSAASRSPAGKAVSVMMMKSGRRGHSAGMRQEAVSVMIESK